MLSEFIRSRLSYSAMPLAGQQTHQWSVQLGPLVVLVPLLPGAQTISSSVSLMRTRMAACYPHELSFSKKRFLIMRVCLALARQVVTGSSFQMTSHGIVLFLSDTHVLFV